MAKELEEYQIPGHHYTTDYTGCQLLVRDVTELLKAQYAIITGGKSPKGCPIITFPDNGTFCTLSDEDYHKLMLYLTSVPSIQEADIGFVLVVDRRNDKWSSVKSILLKISGYFPGYVQMVFVLRPIGFLQKAISEVSYKLFKEEFKFKLIICNSVEDLHEYLQPCQLTEDLGGSIEYNHEDWIRQRMAVEKFSASLHEISTAMREMTERIQETELPNDVSSTVSLLEDQGKEYRELKDEIHSASKQGETLLRFIRRPSTEDTSRNVCQLINVSAIERLLRELDDGEKGFDQFWKEHRKKLCQCLELRKFEQDFKELQVIMTSNLTELNEMPEMGDSVAQIDALIFDLQKFWRETEDDVEKSEQLRHMGEHLIHSNHYAVDSIAPKCLELAKLETDYTQKLERRLDSLKKNRDLMERIEKANKWCTKGVELLASQEVEKCTSLEIAAEYMKQLEDFVNSSDMVNLNDHEEFHSFFKDAIMPEMRALAQQVLKRIEDVQTMCEKRHTTLQKMSSGNSIHSVHDSTTGASPIAGSTLLSRPNKTTDSEWGSLWKTNDLKRKVCINDNSKIYDENSTSSSDSRNSQEDWDKIRHVMAELIETEKVYVSELKSIIQGYKEEMDNITMKKLVPSSLCGKSDVLFGNMEDIYEFHSNVFLGDLQLCSSTPKMVGRCFVQRRETFHRLYSTYCLNKPKSEALRRQCGDDNPFFIECQRKLGHKLPLGAYLLKPVQRITKYQLLLKDMLKYSDGTSQAEIQEALEAMLAVLKFVNDSMHQIAIMGFHGCLSDYGRLLLQDSFNVWVERKNDRIRDLRFKPHQRYIFLYEDLMLFTKKCGREDNPTYAFKNALKTSQIGLTENLSKGSRGERRKFEIWLHGRSQVFIIQAPTLDVKEVWVKQIKDVLFRQFEQLKGENMKQYFDKIKKLSLDGTVPQSPTPLVRTRNSQGSRSWQTCPIPNSNNNHFVTPRKRSEFERRATLSTLRGYHCENGSSTDSYDDGWSTDDFSQTEDEDEDGDIFLKTISQAGEQYIVLGNYEAVDIGEATLKEGQTVVVEKVGCAGWWYVQVTETGSRGWVPASYLGSSNSKNASRSSPSVSSQDSGSGSLRHAVSKSSVSSNISGASVDGPTV